MQKFIESEVKRHEKESKEKVEKAVMKDLENYEKNITGQSKTFQEQISETVGKMAELSERVKNQLNALGEQVHQIQLDMDELKVKGVGGRSKLISSVLLVLGIAFLIADMYLFVTTFGGAINIDSVIMTVVIALIGIVMLFVATLI